MNRTTVNRLKNIALFSAAMIIIIANVFNYFYSYKHLGDSHLQWRIFMYSVGISMFLMMIYIWLNESLKGPSIKVLVSGWVALYLLINVIGVALGYTLHSKGFMSLLFTLTAAGSGHILIRLWNRLF